MIEKKRIFFQTTVFEAWLRVAAWCGSQAENLRTKREVIFLLDRFINKLCVFNMLSNSLFQ
jgi:hypothetical protein